VPSGTSSKKAATDWPSSSSMDFDSGRNSTQGSSSTKDGATSYSACSSASVAGLRPGPPCRVRGCLAQGLDVALPAVRLLVIASAGCGSFARPASAREFPAHQ
jgi:hypothetical protein